MDCNCPFWGSFLTILLNIILQVVITTCIVLKMPVLHRIFTCFRVFSFKQGYSVSNSISRTSPFLCSFSTFQYNWLGSSSWMPEAVTRTTMVGKPTAGRPLAVEQTAAGESEWTGGGRTWSAGLPDSSLLPRPLPFPSALAPLHMRRIYSAGW